MNKYNIVETYVIIFCIFNWIYIIWWWSYLLMKSDF